jgi:hypothetical protein
MNKLWFSNNNLLHKLLTIVSGLYIAAKAYAINVYDVTKDQSGGKTLSNVMDNGSNIVGQGATLVIQIVAFAGVIIVAISLVVLYKASKDNSRERPVSAFVGMFVGGLMAGIGTIVWIVRNSVLG